MWLRQSNEQWTKIMTPFESDRYLAHRGNKCPFCQSDNLDPDVIQSGIDGTYCQSVRCVDCKETWTDHYSLSGVSVDEENITPDPSRCRAQLETEFKSRKLSVPNEVTENIARLLAQYGIHPDRFWNELDGVA